MNSSPEPSTHNEFVNVGGGLFRRDMLERLIQTIRLAHGINPDSWALDRQAPDCLALFVGNNLALIVMTDHGSFMGLGSLEPEDEAAFTEQNLSTDYPYDAFYFRGIGLEAFDRMWAKYFESHSEAVKYLAKQVKTHTNRVQAHNQEILEAIRDALNDEVPEPGYIQSAKSSKPDVLPYRSRTAEVTGFWKQTVQPKDPIRWEEMKERGVLVSTLWDHPDGDLSSWADDRREFTQRAMQVEGISDGAAHRLWMFVKGMKTGDRIIVHERAQPVLGIGIVESDYELVDGTHLRRVKWTDTRDRPIKKHAILDATNGQNLWGLTPISQEGFKSITTALGVDLGDADDSTMKPTTTVTNLDDLSAHFRRIGLSYTPDQIATFYTALQTKGFVVLSGISGTGKSKIAQGFVDILPKPTVESPKAGGQLTFRVNPVEHWVAVPSSQSDRFPPIQQDVQQHVTFVYERKEFPGTAIIKVLNKQRPTLYFTLGKDLADRLRSSAGPQDIFVTTELDQNGQSLSRVHLSLEQTASAGHAHGATAVKVAPNSLFLPVRPDWRDSTSLLGYYNPLTETYEWTDFLHFLLRAVESYEAKDGLAWFVILDEVNLAHVEYYFADLLSIIESGRQPNGLSRDPIRLTYPDTLTDNVPPREIYLPPNLYIIGTVNMDETTHAFSPKVLDRAFTIELTDVDFDNYPRSAPVESGPALTDDQRRVLLDHFTRGGTFAQVRKEDYDATLEEHPLLREWLSSLNRELARDRFHFGYRVFDEVLQFVHNGVSKGMFERWEDAFGHAVYMKVLPKFNGSRARLYSPLISLVAWAKDPDAPQIDATRTAFESALAPGGPAPATVIAGARFERVARRALEMLVTLEQDGFVSFG